MDLDADSFALSLTTAVYFVQIGRQAPDMQSLCFQDIGVEVLLELFCNIDVVKT